MTARNTPSTTVTLTATEKWAARLSTFILWAVIAASALYWLLSAPHTNASIAATSVQKKPHTSTQLLAQLLGAASESDKNPSTAPTSSIADKIQLRGVIAQSDQQGVAILSVDNQAFKPYKSGQEILDGWFIQTVQGRTVTFVNQKQTVQLKLPQETTSTNEDDTPPLERYPKQNVSSQSHHAPSQTENKENIDSKKFEEFDALSDDPLAHDSELEKAAIEALRQEQMNQPNRRSGFFNR